MKKSIYNQALRPVIPVMITIALAFFMAGCEEEPFDPRAVVDSDYLYPQDGLGTSIQNFRIGPQATVVIAFDGLITLEIPADAVTNYVNLVITKKFSVSVDSLVLFPTSFNVKAENAELLKPVIVELKYDPSSLDCQDPYDESCLRMYSCIPADGEDQFSDPENLCLVTGLNCCVDPTGKKVRACFSSFGTFVVGMGK